MANANVPGGGTKRGALAQEEIICRRSTLLPALDVTLGFQGQQFYPLPQAGGVYSPDVMIFRSNHASGYTFLTEPMTLAFLTSAALCRPQLETNLHGQLQLSVNDKEDTISKDSHTA